MDSMGLTKRSFLYIALFIFVGFVMVYVGGSLSEEKALSSTVIDTEGPLHIDVKGIKVAYYDYSPSVLHKTVILLHGMRFSKENWKVLGTLDKLFKEGHRSIAVDLPGYGGSSSMKQDLSHEELLKEFISQVDAVSPVIVSPSMSGEYAVPLVFSNPELLSGWVPVAPVRLNSHQVVEYQKLQLPVLAVYGENDRQFKGQVEQYLGSIPGVEMKMIPDASHPCYLDNPEMWHTSLLEFLSSLK